MSLDIKWLIRESMGLLLNPLPCLSKKNNKMLDRYINTNKFLWNMIMEVTKRNNIQIGYKISGRKREVLGIDTKRGYSNICRKI